MKTRILLIAVFVLSLASVPVVAMQEHAGHATGEQAMTGDGGMDHGGHDGHGMDHSAMDGTFHHMASDGGLDAEFQVMSLASMNMTSDRGETHHIMVNLKKTGEGAPNTDAVGKIKVIGPDKNEQVSPLKNYSGILAANFTFTQPGKYGVICLVKNGDRKHVFKFWYDHM